MKKKASSTRPSRTYKIGKGCPPVATRWKRGQSGNPNGRPKGSRNIGLVVAEVIRQKIPVTENGRTRRIPALEVMLKRLANDAMRNDPRALKFLLSLVDRYAEAPEALTNMDELLAQDEEILARYREN